MRARRVARDSSRDARAWVCSRAPRGGFVRHCVTRATMSSSTGTPARNDDDARDGDVGGGRDASASAYAYDRSAYYPPSSRERGDASLNPFLLRPPTTTTTTLGGEDKVEDVATGTPTPSGGFAVAAGAPVGAPRLVVQSATMYDSPPAAGIPVSPGRAGAGVDGGGFGARTTIFATPRGVFAFAAPNFDDPASREAMEREFARELGTPESELPADLELFIMARQLSRIVRLFALIDIVMCVLNAISGSSYFAALILGPLGGFSGAKLYSAPLVVWYLVFCLLTIGLRMWDFIETSDMTLRVLAFIIIMLELYISRVVVRFYAVLKQIPAEGLVLLRQLDLASRMMPVQPAHY